MSKNRYYLVSRDKESNVVKPIPFSSDDIVSDGNNLPSNENSLCDIDLFTTRFGSKGALVLYLYYSGLIDSYDSDIYIISRNGDSINTLECVYGEDYFGKELRKIAVKKRVREFDNGSINTIFNDFARRMYGEDGFYSFVVLGYSSIYPKFIDYFRDCNSLADMYNCKLRDGAWAFGSYHLIRNIVETYSNYKKNKSNFRDAKGSIKDREAFKADISTFTDKDYVDGQVSLFDMSDGIDKEDYVLSNLDNLSPSAFSTTYTDVQFNKDFFRKYEDDLYALELGRLLDSNTLTVLLDYARISSLQDDISNIRQGLDKIKASLMRKFRDDPVLLNKVYSFILLYNKCMRDNGMGSDEYGRVYNKK